MWRKLKRTILGAILLLAVGSVWVNMIGQWSNLIRAWRKVAQNEEEIKKLTEENRIWEKKIEYSTSSAYLEQQAREKLGLGGPDDYWLVLPPEDKNLDLYPKTSEVEKKPWWRRVVEWIFK